MLEKTIKIRVHIERSLACKSHSNQLIKHKFQARLYQFRTIFSSAQDLGQHRARHILGVHCLVIIVVVISKIAALFAVVGVVCNFYAG